MNPSERYGYLGKKLEQLKELKKEHRKIEKVVQWASGLFYEGTDDYKMATKGKLSDRLEFVVEALVNAVEYLELPKERVDHPVPILTEEEKKQEDERTEFLQTAWGSQDDGCCTPHDEEEDN